MYRALALSFFIDERCERLPHDVHGSTAFGPREWTHPAWYREQRLVAYCPWATFASELAIEVKAAVQALTDLNEQTTTSSDAEEA